MEQSLPLVNIPTNNNSYLPYSVGTFMFVRFVNHLQKEMLKKQTGSGRVRLMNTYIICHMLGRLKL